MTSFYSWRLMFMTFWGKPRGDHHAHDHAHESPAVMTVPLGVLAIGAIFSGMVWYNDFFGDRLEKFFHLGGAETHASAPAEHGEAAPAAHGEAALRRNMQKLHRPTTQLLPPIPPLPRATMPSPPLAKNRMASMATRAPMWRSRLAARSISTPTTTSSTRRMPRRNG